MRDPVGHLHEDLLTMEIEGAWRDGFPLAVVRLIHSEAKVVTAWERDERVYPREFSLAAWRFRRPWPDA